MDGIKKILSMLICLILIVESFLFTDNFLSRKSSYAKNADFYNYEEDYEVLFLGSSHMVMGIAPMELWHDYGITSYNMGNYGQWLPLDYWVLKNALDYTTPKLVVVDVHAIGNDTMYSEGHASQMHEVFDIMPLSRNKIEAIGDLFPKDKRMEFLFRFSLYHSRWNEINSSFWKKNESSSEKGANLDNSTSMDYARVYECARPIWVDSSEKMEEETIGKKYLRKIIELCQSKKIEVALVALPYAPSEGEQRNLNSAVDIANEYKINFLNMNLEYDYLDYRTDLYDEGHLNSSGARKTTYVLGKYLKETYNLLDLRSTEVSAIWEKDYEEYIDYKIEWMKKQIHLDAYLMLLAEDEYNIIIEINDTAIWDVPLYTYLLENIGINSEKLNKDANCIVINSQSGSADVLYNFDSSRGDANTVLSILAEGRDDSGDNMEEYGLCLGNNAVNGTESNQDVSMQVTVISESLGSVIDCTAWCYKVHEIDGNYSLEMIDVFRNDS